MHGEEPLEIHRQSLEQLLPFVSDEDDYPAQETGLGAEALNAVKLKSVRPNAGVRGKAHCQVCLPSDGVCRCFAK